MLRRARRRVLLIVPDAATWTLPAYELALLAAHELPDGPELTVVTPERHPLELFGPVASEAVGRLLHRANGALADRRARRVVAAQAAVEVRHPERGDGNALHFARSIVRAHAFAFGQRPTVVGVARQLERLRLALAGEALCLRSDRFAH